MNAVCMKPYCEVLFDVACMGPLVASSGLVANAEWLVAKFNRAGETM